jgi:hypothetical protein
MDNVEEISATLAHQRVKDKETSDPLEEYCKGEGHIAKFKRRGRG